MILFEENEMEFKTQGICNLNASLNGTVVEEINGMYELEFEYPIDDKYFKELKFRRIVYCKPSPHAKPQPFRIYNISTPIGRTVTVNAYHISYDASGYPVEPFKANSVLTAIAGLRDNVGYDCPFTFKTDITEEGSINIEKPKGLRSILGENIMTAYKPEFYFDHFLIDLKNKRGQNRDVEIRYGKNMLDMNQEENISNVYTAVYPYWYSDEDGLVVLPEKLVKTPGDYNYTKVYILDISDKFEKKPTEEQIRETATKYIEKEKLGIPKVSLTSSFLQLSNSKEYQEYGLLDKIDIGDTVNVIFEAANVSTTARCIKTYYNIKTDRYDSIEIGESVKNLSDSIVQGNKDVIDKIESGKEETVSYFEKAMEELTNDITGNSGGYVRLNPPKNPSEILIMDTEDINTAVIVWRWNKEGLGVSKNGYNGPYVGIGQNGKLVIDEATAYKITAMMIEGGAISSIGGKLLMSLDDEYFEFSHTQANTRTRISEKGFYILDENNETIASLASEESWSELKANKVFANNIENVYTGDANLYVDHDFSGEGLGTIDNPFTSFSQLRMALESNPIINKDVTINILTTSSEIRDTLFLIGLKGSGSLDINYHKNCVHRSPGNGTWCIYLARVQLPVSVTGGRTAYNSNDGAILCDAGNGHGISVLDCAYTNVTLININCKNWGIKVSNSKVRGSKIDFCDTYNAYQLESMSMVSERDSVGNCASFFRLYDGSIFTYGGSDGGYRPYGLKEEVTGKCLLIGAERTQTGSFRTKPPVPPTSNYTKTFNWTSHRTYAYSYSNWSDDDCKQGAWGYGLRGGHMFFDIGSIRSFLNGTVLDGNTITLTRANSGGLSGASNVYINGSTCSSASGTPSYSNQTHLGTLRWGETKTFTLPKSIVESLKNGTCNSLAVYVNSTAQNNYINIVNCSITLKVNK